MNTNTDIYRLPGEKAVDPAAVAITGLIRVAVGGIFGVWAAVEYMAWTWGFHPNLGHPLIEPYIYDPVTGVYWAYLSGRWTPVIAGFLVGSFPAFLAARRSYKKAKAQAGGTDLHGSAHWATDDELKRTGLVIQPVKEVKNDGKIKVLSNLPQNGQETVYVGGHRNKRGQFEYLSHGGPEHVLVFAPTRSGKGVGLVIPTLVTWNQSVVVHDIKGENWALSAGYREKELGNRCLKFDPTNPDGTSCQFNPLEEVRVGTEYEVQDVQNIANMIVDPDGKGLNDHWSKTGHALLVGAILHVLYAERDKTLRGVAAFLSNPAKEFKAIMQDMLSAVHDVDLERGWIDSATGDKTPTHPVVAQSARDMLNKADNEASGVLSTAMSFLTLYRDPIVARNTERSDFRITDLMNDDKPVSLYIVVPPSDKDRLKPLTRLIINQIVRRLAAKMDFANGKSIAGYKHRLLMMIDEFPALGKLDILAESLAFVAGYGLKMYLITQDLTQLFAAYGKDESIISNCHVRIAYAPNKVETAELLSKMAGTTTVYRQTKSYSGKRFGMQSNVSVSAQETQRPLLTADEAMRLPPDDMLIFVAGHSPIYGKKIKYYTDVEMLRRASIPARDKERQ